MEIAYDPVRNTDKLQVRVLPEEPFFLGSSSCLRERSSQPVSNSMQLIDAVMQIGYHPASCARRLR